ncbi:MAG: aspartate aminotransferase family protein [Woeseiaceae bacterium]
MAAVSRCGSTVRDTRNANGRDGLDSGLHQRTMRDERLRMKENMNSTDDIDNFEAVYQDAFLRIRNELVSQQYGNTKATGYAPLPEILSALQIDHWIGSGGMREESFRGFLDRYLEYSVKLRHPLHIAHQVSVPDYPSALAAMINGLTNNPMAIYEMGPAAAAIEFSIVNWMLEKIGWVPQPLQATIEQTNHAAGVLTHGGSLANLTSLLAARARIAPESWINGVPNDLVVLVPPTSHYSVARAVAILGLGESAIVDLPADELGVVQADGIPALLQSITASGRRCMAVIGNACATATGLHDPIDRMADVCEQAQVWFHVDACHGASALLSPPDVFRLKGIERADSVVWDMHKMLQVPAICAAVLFRDAVSFEEAFHQDASYLAYGRDVDSYDSLPRAVECTKAALGFKVFMNLAWRGEAALGQYVHERYQMTKRFWQLLQQTPDFECPYEPETNILCFAYGNEDDLQQQIRDRMVKDGIAHITSAKVAGRHWLRVTVMNPLSDESVFNTLLNHIREAAAVIKTEQEKQQNA